MESHLPGEYLPAMSVGTTDIDWEVSFQRYAKRKFEICSSNSEADLSGPL
jgi:hypothetical protein